MADQAVTDVPLEKTADQIYELLHNDLYQAIVSATSATQKLSGVVQQNLSGTDSVSSLFNTAVDQSFRDWTPSTEDLNNMVRAGMQSGSLADRIRYYNEKFPMTSAIASSRKAYERLTSAYSKFATVTTNAAFSLSDESFDKIPSIMKELNELYSLIDRPQTLKQSVGTNSAILIKVIELETELLRLQSQQLKLQAVAQQENNNKRLFMATFIKEIK